PGQHAVPPHGSRGSRPSRRTRRSVEDVGAAVLEGPQARSVGGARRLARRQGAVGDLGEGAEPQQSESRRSARHRDAAGLPQRDQGGTGQHRTLQVLSEGTDVSHATYARQAPVVSTARAKGATAAARGGLRVRDANEMYEQEADHVAEDVMTGRAARWHWSLPRLSIGSSLQRKCSCGGSGGADGECDECKKKEGASLQRQAAGPAGS